MLERIRACLASLAPAEQRVATLVLRDPAGAAYRQRQTPAAAARDESQPARQALPIPVFRLGSQKSPWLVAADVLAAYIDGQRDEATKQWLKLQRAS